MLVFTASTLTPQTKPPPAVGQRWYSSPGYGVEIERVSATGKTVTVIGIGPMFRMRIQWSMRTATLHRDYTMEP